MAFQPCPGIASLTISAQRTGESDITQNILHFSKNDLSTWGPSDVEGLVNNFDTWLGTDPGKAAMLTYLDSTYGLVQLTGRDLSVDGGAEYV